MTPTLLAQYGRYANDWMMIQQMQQVMGDSRLIYLQIVLTVGFFLIIIFKSERITTPLLMKWAYLTLIASFVMPVLFRMLLSGVVEALQSGTGGGINASSWMLQIPSVMEPILIGLCMLLAFSSFSIESGKQRSYSQPPPARHPLD